MNITFTTNIPTDELEFKLSFEASELAIIRTIFSKLLTYYQDCEKISEKLKVLAKLVEEVEFYNKENNSEKEK